MQGWRHKAVNTSRSSSCSPGRLIGAFFWPWASVSQPNAVANEFVSIHPRPFRISRPQSTCASKLHFVYTLFTSSIEKSLDRSYLPLPRSPRPIITQPQINPQPCDNVDQRKEADGMIGSDRHKSPQNPSVRHCQHEFSDTPANVNNSLQKHSRRTMRRLEVTISRKGHQKTVYIHKSMPRRRRKLKTIVSSFVLMAMAPQLAAAQTCVSLEGSTSCPAFVDSSIIPSDYLITLFPFLSNVTDRQSFDTGIQQYVGNGYVQQKYVRDFGCSGIDLSNTTELYARYTLSFICNAIIQNSISACNLSTAQSRPLCADSCADFATSEQTIISSPDLCGTAGSNAMAQLRADFTNCALPADSITGTCIAGYSNEPSNCGFQSNLDGLCTYCSTSTANSTDSCCYNSDVSARCRDVTLPSYVSTMQALFSTTTNSPASSTSPTSMPSAAAAAGSGSTGGLTGGQIAGIVIGSLVGFGLMLGLLICCCLFLRRKKKQQEVGTLNQPSPPRTGPAMMQTGHGAGFQALPGSRVTRMSALEGPVVAPGQGRSIPSTTTGSSPSSFIGGIGAVGAAAAALPRRNKIRDGPYDGSSPESGGYTSPDVPESEQMESFKDYYSADEIHPGNLVSTLWAYSPRAPDEFELERGDMIKIVGIWDDGWATGVKVDRRADEWEASRELQRDSGVSSNNASPPNGGMVKAFPLVCVCLPQHWRKTIEGDSTDPPSTDSAHLS